MGCSPLSRKELDMTVQLTQHNITDSVCCA